MSQYRQPTDNRSPEGRIMIGGLLFLLYVFAPIFLFFTALFITMVMKRNYYEAFGFAFLAEVMFHPVGATVGWVLPCVGILFLVIEYMRMKVRLFPNHTIA